jgi:threonylcarbamoyladenosine tRNA methylthiotransferase MtaB
VATSPEKVNTYIKTLGCKVNSYDSAMLEKEFEKNGHTIVSKPEDAELLVINSCSVTATAEKETRYLLRKYKRENPKAYRVVTGCYAQINSGELEDLATPHYIVPNEQKSNLVSLVSEAFKKKEDHSLLPESVKAVTANKQSQFKLEKVLFGSHKISRTRAYIKVQDGCNNFCAYCQIPYARGSSKSVPSDDILKQIEDLTADGIREVILTGIDIGDYGIDLKDDKKEECISFEALIAKILKATGLERIRISSMEPLNMTEGFLKILSRHKNIFCEHFHLPLQSGSKRILTLMGRSYTKEFYKDACLRIRKYFPDALISADIIPGFPGETEEEFEESLQFVKDCKLGSLHVFPYSKRPNTRAMRMPGHLEPSLIKERSKILRTAGEELETTFAESFIGKPLDVLWEGAKETRLIGKSRNYLSVLFSGSDKPESGTITRVTPTSYNKEKKLLVVE